MSRAVIRPLTIDSGILHYEPGDRINLGLTFPLEYAPTVARMLADFNSLRTNTGHFQPGRTIEIETVHCRITQDLWNPETCAYTCDDLINAEVELLSSLDQFSIHIHSPLRMPRPKGSKRKGHHYCDEDFFLNTNPQHPTQPMDRLIQMIRFAAPRPASDVEPEPSGLELTSGALTWLDVAYGNDSGKTIGGVVGRITVTGTVPEPIARRLVIGQYTGAGKNSAFGFGAYSIPELSGVAAIAPLSRGVSLLSRAFSVEALRDALAKLPDSAPGQDTLTLEDARKAADLYLAPLSQRLLTGSYQQGGSSTYRLPKPDGSYREIQVFNVTDRLVHRAAADLLTPVIDRLLLESAYAYRRGLNRKGAASALQQELQRENPTGVKADISAFFDSVNIDSLRCMLDGLFPCEPLIDLIIRGLIMVGRAAKGLPQGSPLSPVLSNLYLLSFDKEMEREGFRLIRYGDDFAVFFSDPQYREDGLEKVKTILARLGLNLKPEKTVDIRKGTAVEFLGYLITPGDIVDVPKEHEQEDWAPVFKEEWLSGTPVYLTSICRGAYSNGPSLIIHMEGNRREDIPWNRISRIVVVGRSSFSGGVVYRAVREKVPVTFIDVMSQLRGHLFPEHAEMPELSSLQLSYSKDEGFCLSFAREIISAKVHNSYVILRRHSISSEELKRMAEKVEGAQDMDTLRGYEGAAARIYFSEIANLVAPFEFNGRRFYPADDPVNAMLSFGYTLLYNRLAAVVKDKGYNPRVGFFHKGRGTHAALASDLMEELRHIPERIVLSLIHRGEIHPQDFSATRRKDTQVCRLTGDGFRKYIHRFETTMATKASYHGIGKLSYNAYLDEMADILKRALKMGIAYKALRIN